MATSDKKSPILASIDKYQATWLSALASRSTRSEKVNTRKMFVELNDQLPEDFDPSQIDGRLCAGGNLITVFGRAFVNPKDKHVQETNLVAQAIRSILIANPETTNIYVGDISQKIELAEQNIADILESMAGFVGGGYFHTSGTSYGLSGWQSIRIDDELLRKFIQFESIEALLKKRILKPMKPSEKYDLILQIQEKMVQKTLNQIKLFFRTCQIPQDEDLPSFGKAKYVETVLRDLTDAQIEMVATELGVLQIVDVGVEDFRPTGVVPRKQSVSETYDVALSFAGEDRNTVEKLAEMLKESDYKVFYDKYESANLWGKNLYVHLTDVYRDKARYCVMFLSCHYKEKLWTNHEREAAQARAFRESSEYILPVRIDDTEIPGILETTGYLSLEKYSIEEVFELLKEKLKS